METTRDLTTGREEYATLLCPNCGARNLHHAGVTIYDRQEDAKVTTVTRVGQGNTDQHLIKSDTCGNPSDRRDGLAILFYCETCPAISELMIWQHKGETRVQWRWVGERKIDAKGLRLEPEARRAKADGDLDDLL
jgi:hypothetical protein